MTNVAKNVLASLRHDLRAQIGVIVDCCELLLDDEAKLPGPDSRADVGRMQGAAWRLLTLVDDLFGPGAGTVEVIDPAAMGSQLRHELRTPLNHIIGYAEMMLEEAEGAGEATLTEDLGRIRAAGRRLTDMLDQALASLTAPETANGVSETIEEVEKDLDPKAPPLKGRVLIVDDDEVNRDVLSRRVSTQGADVAVAASGKEALAMLHAKPFDAVLLDVMMPEMSGYAVLREMKTDTSLRDIPVIMISALDEIGSAVRCIRLGAEDYLAKPFDPTLLRARLGACIEKKHLRDREVVHLRTIDEERRRADGLLRAIFPMEIVRELKASQSVRPRRYDNVAVLFSDVVGFTSYAEALDPELVIGRLQELVETQEEIAEAHGMEKIKTIGDGFMAAAGMLRPDSDPVLTCVRCGLAMIERARGLDPSWDLRIGVHVGPLVGGVLGKRQYLFDLVGDTVNTASRVENAGLPGTVSLSGTAWQQIAHLSVGRSLGLVPVKGREEIEIVQFERFA